VRTIYVVIEFGKRGVIVNLQSFHNRFRAKEYLEQKREEGIKADIFFSELDVND
jgi:hypothetical protein